jgi:DNA-binding CsgD family transcriptional regulator
VRAVAYLSASFAERQQVHSVLAEVTDPATDPARRAWHRAQAADGPDEEVAAELEASAGRAQARGGMAAAAAFLERAILTRRVQLVRDAGALDHLPIYLESAGIVAAWNGDFGLAASLIAEVNAVREVTGSRFPSYAALLLACLRGSQAEAVPLTDAMINSAEAGGMGRAATTARWMAAMLYNGLGRYEEAREAARQAAEDPSGSYVFMWALPELIEAEVRSGNKQMAGDVLQRLAATTQVTGTDFGLGMEARSRALVAEGQAADGLYREAIDRLGRTRLRPELARALLVYGEWLRRRGRRPQAREQLRTADTMLNEIGMDAFAERARRELAATGETARKRTAQAAVAASQELTAQDAQVARLARDGLSNPEIGARLFISPHTVQYHLRKIFAKLGISTRGQLHQVLPGGPDTAGR